MADKKQIKRSLFELATNPQFHADLRSTVDHLRGSWDRASSQPVKKSLTDKKLYKNVRKASGSALSAASIVRARRSRRKRLVLIGLALGGLATALKAGRNRSGAQTD